MSVTPIYKRSGYVPFTDDPNLRRRIQQSLDTSRNIPKHIPEIYPDRGKQIEMKYRIILQGAQENLVYTEPSPFPLKTRISDLLCVMCVFGNSQSRISAQKEAIRLLSEMNPLPRIILLEGSTDGQWYFDYVKNIPEIDYVPVNLQFPQFRNFFGKEMLWNQAAHTVIDANKEVKYLVFLDADTFFIDRGGWIDIRNTFNTYDIISPFKYCYYTGNRREAEMFKMLPSTGHKILEGKHSPGYQGFGIGMSVAAYEYYFKGELPNPSLGLGDNMYWYMLCGNNIMKGFNLLPYEEAALKPYVFPSKANIGCTQQILGHIDHGPVDARIYKVRSQFMKMGVKEPLKETARVLGGGYLVGWADTPDANDLRLTYEHLLVENRRELKILTREDAAWYYDWFHGRRPDPPKCIRRNKIVQNDNMLPNWECSRNVFSTRSTL